MSYLDSQYKHHDHMHAFEYTCANGQTQSPEAKESPSITQ